MQRFGQVLCVKPEKEAYYRQLHANAWEGVLDKITDCNIRNYSIFLRDGFLFAYFEYVGDDFEKDMQKMADDPLTQEWWAECKPCQQPIDTAKGDEWWVTMESVFFHP